MPVRTSEKIVRLPFMAMYKENMVAALIADTGCSKEEALAFVEEKVTQRFKDPKVKYVDNPRNGVANIDHTTLSGFIGKFANNIIVPSGSVYLPAYVEKSFISGWVAEGKKERKIVKNKQLKAAEIGDKLMEGTYKYGQNTIKTRLNSLPGGYGSEYNIFYCKAGYNSITSSARALIATAFTTAEQVLGGNFAWFTEEEAINYAILCNKKSPSSNVINTVMNKYGIKPVSVDLLFNWMKQTVNQYNRRANCSNLYSILKGLPDHTIQYLFYHNNLRHLLWANHEVYHPLLSDMLSYSNHDDESIDCNKFFKIDHDLLAVVFTLVTNDIKSVKASELGEKVLGSEEFKHPRLTRLCVRVAKEVQSKLNALDELMETFTYTNFLTPNILTRKNMFRNTVIISDTDSVIFTTKDWVEWYVGQSDCINDKSYNIAALATYWLTKVNGDSMAKYSISIGATGEDVKIMQMKNEFLYPTLLLYDIKKTYAGVIQVQEGVILPKPRTDIKGAQLRSSAIAEESVDFAEDMIINDIILPGRTGKLSANHLIDKVLTYENTIRTSLNSGELTFLSTQSVKNMEEYPNPDSSPWAYCNSWNIIFGEKYGSINPPGKFPMVKLLQITTDYLEWLKGEDQEIYSMMNKYIAAKGRLTGIVINPLGKCIPKELIPLINTRHIIHSNLKPSYLTLERLGIGTGRQDDQVMFSDVYMHA